MGTHKISDFIMYSNKKSRELKLIKYSYILQHNVNSVPNLFSFKLNNIDTKSLSFINLLIYSFIHSFIGCKKKKTILRML